MNQFAIIGPTASGKSALAVECALKVGGVILSLDSLAVFNGGNIASAKPSKQERGGIVHFGFDLVELNQNFNAALFFEEYKNASAYAKSQNAPLIIVGGTSFYLKALIDGLSELPPINDEIKQKAAKFVKNDIGGAMEFLRNIDKDWLSADAYRVTRGLEIYYAFNGAPSEILKNAKKEPLCPNLQIYEIEVDRDVLRERIAKRTLEMFKNGLIDEVKDILQKFGDEIKYCKAIGPKEIISYLKNEISLKETEGLIDIHTAQLAKRQRTFNKTQFRAHILKDYETLKEIILK